ncbi:MAG: DUF4834 family protein [Parabacteroides sp.]
MFKFFFMLFFLFVLMLLLLGFSVVRTFKNILFGSGNDRKRENHQHRSSKNTTSSKEDYPQGEVSRKKIFTKEDGEYVDYEDVK